MIRLLAVGPHPDDVEYGCGGLLAGADPERTETHVAVFPPTDQDGDPLDEAVRRMDEARDAADVFGATFHELPPLAPTDRRTAVHTLTKLLAALRPHIVITVDPDDAHPWHAAVSSAVREAVFTAQTFEHDAGASGPAQLLYMDAYTTVDFNPDLYIDVSRSFPTAWKALRHHETGLAITPALGHQMRLRHQVAGCRASAEMAEGFRLSHDFGQDWCTGRAVLYRLLVGAAEMP
jgi:LmbE family N-acetylglucosaminyl deacetylase